VKNSFPIDFKWKEEEDAFINTINHLPSEVEVVSYELDPETFVMVKVRESASNSTPTPIVTEVPKPKVELIKEAKKITEPIVKKEKSIVNSTTSTKKSGNLHLVVGCFSTEQNANELITKLKSNGIDAYIVDQSNGLHRVSAVSGSSDSAFSSTKEKLATLKMTGWLLRK
jgi:cell division septation protein DedD